MVINLVDIAQSIYVFVSLNVEGLEIVGEGMAVPSPPPPSFNNKTI